LENLALIPGTVGASPVQNIGAYGLELADRFHSLRAFDWVTGDFRDFTAHDCRFGYRDSVFKGEPASQENAPLEGARYIITSVTFALPRPWQARAAYADLAKALHHSGIIEPTARDIFDAVVAVRRAKLPDPAQIGNAGSFFKNPIISGAQYAALRTQRTDIVAYAQTDGRYKLAAGWLIDQCGWKGRALGLAAVHPKQALVLVNPGQASGADVLALAHAISHDVMQRFGVALEVEPLIV
jgi:UDP-N-acetylmuramate dehydrogenase